MKGKILRVAGFISAVVILIVTAAFSGKRKISVEGVWKIVEVRTVKSNGSYTTVIPTESEAIFAKGHYSFCWTSHASAARNWQMPDSVKLARMNQSIVNTGTYTLADSVLITKAVFAMNPMFVNGEAKFNCFYSGDTLVLRGLSVISSDNILHPVYAGGSYIVSKLVRVRK